MTCGKPMASRLARSWSWINEIFRPVWIFLFLTSHLVTFFYFETFVLYSNESENIKLRPYWWASVPDQQPEDLLRNKKKLILLFCDIVVFELITGRRSPSLMRFEKKKKRDHLVNILFTAAQQIKKHDKLFQCVSFFARSKHSEQTTNTEHHRYRLIVFIFTLVEYNNYCFLLNTLSERSHHQLELICRNRIISPHYTRRRAFYRLPIVYLPTLIIIIALNAFRDVWKRFFFRFSIDVYHRVINYYYCTRSIDVGRRGTVVCEKPLWLVWSGEK